MSHTPKTDAVCMAHPVRPERYTKRQWARDQAVIGIARDLERENAAMIAAMRLIYEDASCSPFIAQTIEETLADVEAA